MEIKAAKFCDINPNKFGIVIVGCDLTTKENRDGFVNGVTSTLIEKQVVDPCKPEDLWEEILQTTSTGGRTDLIFVARQDAKMDIPRFAIVRLRDLPDCSWIDDWKHNYADHYGERIHIYDRDERDDDDK